MLQCVLLIRLRELEQATTPEQKQEVLRLFKLESEPVVENQLDYITKLCNGFLQDDKFSSYLNIRKGKVKKKPFDRLTILVQYLFFTDVTVTVIASVSRGGMF